MSKIAFGIGMIAGLVKKIVPAQAAKDLRSAFQTAEDGNALLGRIGDTSALPQDVQLALRLMKAENDWAVAVEAAIAPHFAGGKEADDALRSDLIEGLLTGKIDAGATERQALLAVRAEVEAAIAK